MLRIERDDLTRPEVLALLEEHLRKMYELSPTEGEVKSMRTPSALRRTGAGRALLNHIIEVARSRAYRVLYLETGCHPAFQPAQLLYRSAGFQLCGPFGAYRDNGNSVFMSLALAAV